MEQAAAPLADHRCKASNDRITAVAALEAAEKNPRVLNRKAGEQAREPLFAAGEDLGSGLSRATVDGERRENLVLEFYARWSLHLRPVRSLVACHPGFRR